MTGSRLSQALQLVRVDAKPEAVLWSFRADSSGQFAIENVPHGRYRVRVIQGNGVASHRSLAFEIGDGRNGITVEWPSG